MEQSSSWKATITHIMSGSKQVFDSIVSDDIISVNGAAMPFRVLLLENKSRVEFPMDQFIVTFSSERQISAEAKAKAEFEEKSRAEAEAKAQTENT